MLPPEECLETTQLASEQGSPVHSILLEADKAMVPSHKVREPPRLTGAA